MKKRKRKATKAKRQSLTPQQRRVIQQLSDHTEEALSAKIGVRAVSSDRLQFFWLNDEGEPAGEMEERDVVRFTNDIRKLERLIRRAIKAGLSEDERVQPIVRGLSHFGDKKFFRALRRDRPDLARGVKALTLKPNKKTEWVLKEALRFKEKGLTGGAAYRSLKNKGYTKSRTAFYRLCSRHGIHF